MPTIVIGVASAPQKPTTEYPPFEVGDEYMSANISRYTPNEILVVIKTEYRRAKFHETRRS